MTDVLERECEVFCRYLSGAAPSEYVRAQYAAAHAVGVIDPEGGSTRFERSVVALARSGPFVTRLLDSYSRVFANGALLRRKLVLLLAVLEVRSPHAEAIDTPTGSSSFPMLLVMAWLGLRFALSVVVGALALLPVRVWCAVRGLFGGAK